MRLRPRFSDPNLDFIFQAQAELDRRQRARMQIAALTQADKPKDAANDNLLSGFALLPVFQYFIDQPLGSQDWRAAFSGRGDGKSWGVVDAAIYWAYHIPNLRICVVRMKEADLELSMMALFPDRLQHWGLWGVVARWSNGKIVFDNGSEVLFVGLWKGGKPEGVKSLEGANLTIIEEASEVSAKALEVLIPTVMRTELSEIWAIWNPKSAKDAIDALLRGEFPPERSIIKRIHRSDNPHFTDKNRRQMEADFKRNPVRAAHVWDGEYEPSAEGAMWTRGMIDAAILDGQRLGKGMIKRVVIGVDPAGGGGDEIGIVAVAELFNGKACVLGDYSMSPSDPLAWGKEVGRVARGWNADCVVAESNFGGDLVKSNLRVAGVRTRVKMVHASRGKHVRAEPIAGRYDAGEVWHRQSMPALEEQLLHMTPQGYAVDKQPGQKKSPDRLDACTWALTEIFSTPAPEVKAVVAKKK